MVGATILETVFVFGGWDYHRDVKLLIVAGIGPSWCYVSLGSREFSICRATSYLKYGNSSWREFDFFG